MKGTVEFRTVLLILLAIVIVVSSGILYGFYKQQEASHIITHPAADVALPPSSPTNNNSTSLASTTATMPAVSNTSTIFISSSTTQVGDFTVIADCGTRSVGEQASVGEIDILKNGSVVQTISTKGISPGSESCPKPQSQDINFDGYPDFMIDGDYGTGGDSVYYWLYNTTTQQFYCPGGNYFNCSLINPSFDTASKTISESDSLGASNSVFYIDHVSGNSIIPYQETDVTYLATSTIKIVKQLENGQMEIISTSSISSDNDATPSAASTSLDSQRATDIITIQNDLELYYNKCGFYPGTANCENAILPSWDSLVSTLINADIGVSSVPNDPAGGSATYVYGPDGDEKNQSYLLEATFDNPITTVVGEGYKNPVIPTGTVWTSSFDITCTGEQYCSGF